MNIAKYSLDNSKVIYFFLAVMLIGGILSFGKLAKKEDAPFVIKQAVLIAQYPGATPAEVEQLITEVIERDIQTTPNTWKIKSDSYYGMAKITIELQPYTPPDKMPIMWDALRRKVLNVQQKLPQGATITVNDDFGDVFGIYYGLTADEGFSYEELRDWAQKLKTELSTIDGVMQISLFGEQTPTVNVFISLSKLANLGVEPAAIIQTINSQNKIINTGNKLAGEMEIKLYAEGTYKTIEDIRNQIISTRAGQQIRLGDIARVEKGYLNPPSTLMRVNGKRAIGIGISSAGDKDVVRTGDLINEQLQHILPLMPVGINLETLYPENQIAREANNGFIINLIESVAIVILILMFVMGFKASILIGSSLLFCIGGTMLIMQFMNVGLNRTSLAGFIIAMGMLVDNAIVVTDNTQVGMARGLSKRKAIIDGATAPQWGLLGATLIAIFSFLPLFLAQASVAEIVKPLFVVIGVSLALSWILALTQTTTFANLIFKEDKGKEPVDPYDKKFYHKFDRLLTFLIRHRWVTIGSMVGLFFLSIAAMGLMPQSFFPNLDKPYFRADCIFPNGYNIRDVERQTVKIEKWLQEQPSVKNVSITMGGTPPRYYLASASYGPMPNYANVLVELTTKDSSAVVEDRFNAYVKRNYPNILVRSSLFKVSPVPEATIEIGFIGNNIDTLIALTEQVKDIMRSHDDMVSEIRNSWGNRIPVWKPVYSQDKGQRLGVTRQTMAQSMSIATTGMPLGEYREKDQFWPILLKDEKQNDFNLNDLRTLPLFSSYGRVVPLEQATEGFEFDYDFYYIRRYNRQRIMLAQCDPLRGANAKEAFNTIYRETQEKVKVPEGYKLKFMGEEETQADTNKAIGAVLPLTLILIFITLLLLFRAYKKPVVILCMVPLISIGAVLGLLVLGKSFDFFCMLGMLGLIGMNIKNAIVLVDQIGTDLNAGRTQFEAVISATRSRIVPVTMASGTTILGMLPLLPDAMFGGMAATIMGGLLVASLLTLLILPVTYCIMFNVKAPKKTAQEQ